MIKTAMQHDYTDRKIENLRNEGNMPQEAVTQFLAWAIILKRLGDTLKVYRYQDNPITSGGASACKHWTLFTHVYTVCSWSTFLTFVLIKCVT